MNGPLELIGIAFIQVILNYLKVLIHTHSGHWILFSCLFVSFTMLTDCSLTDRTMDQAGP